MCIPGVMDTHCKCSKFHISSICIFLADCGTLTDPVNGFVFVESTTEGSTATYTCKNGLIHNLGDLERFCRSSGEWSGTPPTCVCELKQS